MNYFIKVALACAVPFLVAACSVKPAENTEAEQALEVPKAKAVYGKIQHVDLGSGIDLGKAKAGAEIFNTKCNACHKLDERYVGPALGQVTVRRTPEYVMNMILDTETMLENDDTVKCLMQEYLMRMPNQSVDEKDARNVLEHLRSYAASAHDKSDTKQPSKH